MKAGTVMVFSSAVFLFMFLPVVLILHTAVKNITARNGLLIVASLVFYAYGEPVYVLLLLASVSVNYLFGRKLAATKSRLLLGISVTLNLLLLVAFKYVGFLVDCINYIPGISIPAVKVTMPIGISFFTFQAISYLIDTYRSDRADRPGFFRVLLYISLFPQLIAGPIVRYDSIKAQLEARTVRIDRMAGGIRRFIFGLAKKMLIANRMGYVADGIFGLDTGRIDSPLAWLGAVCYTLQIYFDFSGYSDMAVGLGMCLGFDFPENFRHPLSASGIRDFWRRWHMSLTGWFREYLYIPLGGNRKGIPRKLLNTMIVFVCTGIWHGANWTFVLWGLFHGLLMCAETLISRGRENRRWSPFKWIYTIFAVVILFVIFRADSVGYAFSYIGRMFAFSVTAGGYREFMSYLTPVFAVTFFAAVIASTPIVPYVSGKIKSEKLKIAFSGVCYVASTAVFTLCVMTLASDSYNPFIYFRF